MNLGTYFTAADIEQERYETELWFGLLEDTPEEEFDREFWLAERRHEHDFVDLGAMDWRLAAAAPPSSPSRWGAVAESSQEAA